MSASLPDSIRNFVESTPWTFAKTYATTWPHEYVVRSPENASMILALAHHIFKHGQDGRFYSQVRKYHHEGGKVYWSMDETPEATTLINRCDEDQTYESRSANGNFRVSETMIAEPGVVADRSRLQEGYRSMGKCKGKFQGARKRAGS